MANPALNGMILAALLIGIVFISRQILLLGPEAAWVRSFRSNNPGMSVGKPPRLLGPIATMLGERQSSRMSLSTLSLRSLLDSLDARLAESRDTSRYLIGLLIFLGLLGTFWGLLETVGSVCGCHREPDHRRERSGCRVFRPEKRVSNRPFPEWPRRSALRCSGWPDH